MGLGMALRLLELRLRGAACATSTPRASTRRAAHGATVCADAGAAGAGPRAADRRRGRRGADASRCCSARGGAVHGLAPARRVLLCPTIAPQAVEAVAAGAGRAAASTASTRRCRAARPRARDGTMSLMVACADAVFERWQGAAAATCRRGCSASARAPGDGARTKLVNNLLAGDQPGRRGRGAGAGAAARAGPGGARWR